MVERSNAARTESGDGGWVVNLADVDLMKKAEADDNCRYAEVSHRRECSRREIVLLGMNHKTADVELRECIGFSEADAEVALTELRETSAIEEIVLLSTCNRVEIMMATPDPEAAVDAACRYISTTKRLPVNDFREALYQHTGDEAVRHIFRVASSLDSMVVGEPQILGQIKEAYRTATEKRTSGVILNRLMHRTFFVAKRVRSETGIGDHAVSISYAAIELGRKIFGTLEGKNVMLIGAGEMAELAVEHLIRHRAGDIYVANRTYQRGLELARRFNGKAIRFDEVVDTLAEVDIIISSTGATNFILTRDQVKKTIRPRKNRPLFFIDIAVPRDIDPSINRLANTYVYDIDDLKDVIEENVEDRRREAKKAERIIDESVLQFRRWYEELDVVPTIVALRKKLWSIVEAEAEKTLGHSLANLSETEAQAIYRMNQAVVNKFLHDPTIFLKRNGCSPDKSAYLDMARKLFRLDEAE